MLTLYVTLTHAGDAMSAIERKQRSGQERKKYRRGRMFESLTRCMCCRVLIRSSLRSFVRGISRVVMSSQFREVLERGRISLELAVIDQKRAQVNREYAQAAADFLKSIESVTSGVAQFGSLIIVKKETIGGRSFVMTRVLNASELEFMQNNSSLMIETERLLDWLDETSP